MCNGKLYISIKERNMKEDFSFYLKEKGFKSYNLEEDYKLIEECEILIFKRREIMGKKGEKKEEDNRKSMYFISISLLLIYRS